MPASQVFSGSGSPNGTVDGSPGDVYQDQTGKLWINTAAPSTWARLIPGGSAFTWQVGVSWASIYAELSSVPGPKICLVAFDVTGSRQMTNNGGTPTDLNEILFVGVGGTGDDDTCVGIAVEDGFKLQPRVDVGGEAALLTSRDVSWDFQALTAPAYTTPNPATDRAVFTIEGGRLRGSSTVGQAVVNGTLWLALNDVFFVGGNVGIVVSANSVLRMTRRTTLFGGSPFVDDGGGNGLPIFTDATCSWNPSDFVGQGLTPGATVNNFALGPTPAGPLYAISVDGGGNVVATPV